MSVRSTILAAAALGAGLVNLGFAAAPAIAQPQGVAVPYQDLNLSHAAGSEALDRRIAAAARSLCGEYLTVELKWSEMSRVCQEDVIAAFQPHRDALVGERHAALSGGASRAAN